MLQEVKVLKITAGILFYLLDRYGDMQHICHGADRMELKRFEHFRNQKETEASVLYIFSDKKGVLLFCGEKKYKPSYILMKALKETDADFSSLWIPYANLDEGRSKNSHLADEVSEYVGQIWNYFTQVQNEILEAILSQKKVDEVMEIIRGLLRTPFTIVDRDMLLLYENPDLVEVLKAKIGEDYPEEITEELLVAKEFHEVAKKKEPFYYYMESLGQNQYCINIDVDGYYYARLVVYPGEGNQILPSGAEQISEYVAGVIVQMIRNGSLQTSRSQNDQFHLVCHKVLEGQRVDDSEIREAVLGYQWAPANSYQVFILEPYNAAGWETQIENTMPTMTRKLEQTWFHSCAVFSGKEILWVINWTLSEETKNAYEFSQELMVLLRENVFRSGVSSRFSDAMLLTSALKEARAALEVGTKKDPNSWYFRFDDYRLSFMLDAIREQEIAPMLLVHPAIPVLMEYDKTHESQLADTLKMLVEKQGNVTQAADALFIHRTTLFRRLNQVKEMTGLDLNDMDLMLELQLSYRILE